jgi:multidrug transporter EmrE-like cation transporter
VIQVPVDSSAVKMAFARLDALAAKLNVAAPQVWQILIRQAYAEAIVALVGFGVFAIVFAINFPKAVRAGDNFVPSTLYAILSGVGLVGFTIAVCRTLDQLINPGYYALHEVLRLLK